MTNTDIGNEFDAIAAKLRAAGDPDEAARDELFREWVATDSFCKELADLIFSATE